MPETLDQLETDLGPDLRALAPQADADFVRHVTAPRRRRRRRIGGRLWLPALAVAATALAALVVALAALDLGRDGQHALFGGGGGSAGGGEGVGAPELGRGGDPAGRGQAPGASPAVPSPSLAAPVPGVPDALGAARVVERSAEVTLTTEPDRVDGLVADLARLARTHGGYVLDASVQSGGDEASGVFTLRVRGDRLDALLERLGELATIASLRRDNRDITAPTAAAERRLADARDERAALRRALRRATDPRRIDELRARLRVATARVERRERSLQQLRRRGDLATVAITVRGSDSGWSPGVAPGAALRVLGAVAGGLLIALAAALPPLALLALVLPLARLLRRRRREAVLAG